MPRDREPFATLSARLAANAGLAPVEPHITVIGSVDADIDPACDPFDVQFVALADSDEKFRCITVTVAPNATLLGLRSGETPYEPHLSLLYGELPDATRAALRAGVDLALPMHTPIDALAVWDTSSDDHAGWSEVRRITLRDDG